MVRRILRSMYAVGLHKPSTAPAIDMAKHNAVALETAQQGGIVLLKNDGMLPLSVDTTARIAVIGGYAQLGALPGSGSSAVTPPGGFAAAIPIGGEGILGRSRNMYFLLSSPMSELRKLLPKAQITFESTQRRPRPSRGVRIW
jgi:beta-glucosidase